MAALKEITTWLNSGVEKDWSTAAELLLAHTRFRTLGQRLKKRPLNKQWQNKALYLLEQHRDRLEKAPVKPVVKKVKRKPKAKPPSIQIVEEVLEKPADRFTPHEFNALPDPVKDLETGWKDLYKKRAHLCAIITYMPTQEARHEAAQQILDFGKAIDQTHTDLDYFKDHGILPDRGRKSEVPSDLAEVERQLRATNTRISKKRALEKKGPLTDAQQAAMKKDQELKALLIEAREEFKLNG